MSEVPRHEINNTCIIRRLFMFIRVESCRKKIKAVLKTQQVEQSTGNVTTELCLFKNVSFSVYKTLIN